MSDVVEQWKEIIDSDLQSVKDIIEDATRHQNEEIETLMKYAVKPYGKMIRPAMCILSYYACGGACSEKIQRFAAAAELLHTSTLVHDDINDGSDYRRGQPSMFRNFGTKKSLVIGDMLMMNAFALVKDDFTEYSDFVKNIAFSLANSEFEQARNEFNLDISGQDYLNIISGKTAMFFSQCARIGALSAGSDERTAQALEKYGLLYGIGFQIADDILDVVGTSDGAGKSIGIDLKDGKMTLPTILAMRDPDYGDALRHMVKGHRDVSQMLGLIRQTGSIDRCVEIASRYFERATDELTLLSESDYKESLIQLAQSAMRRLCRIIGTMFLVAIRGPAMAVFVKMGMASSIYCTARILANATRQTGHRRF